MQNLLATLCMTDIANIHTVTHVHDYTFTKQISSVKLSKISSFKIITSTAFAVCLRYYILYVYIDGLFGGDFNFAFSHSPPILNVTESRKTVPNHTFLFHYIYYCNMNGIKFSTLFHIITWSLMLKLSKLYNKYSRNTYA